MGLPIYLSTLNAPSGDEKWQRFEVVSWEDDYGNSFVNLGNLCLFHFPKFFRQTLQLKAQFLNSRLSEIPARNKIWYFSFGIDVSIVNFYYCWMGLIVVRGEGNERWLGLHQYSFTMLWNIQNEIFLLLWLPPCLKSVTQSLRFYYMTQYVESAPFIQLNMHKYVKTKIVFEEVNLIKR